MNYRELKRLLESGEKTVSIISTFLTPEICVKIIKFLSYIKEPEVRLIKDTLPLIGVNLTEEAINNVIGNLNTIFENISQGDLPNLESLLSKLQRRHILIWLVANLIIREDIN